MNKFNSEKAGCQINQNVLNKIEELQTNSELGQREKEKKEAYNEKLSEFKLILSSLPKTQIEKLKIEIDKTLAKLEEEVYNTGSPEEFFCFFDCDMFFAACEINHNPKLADKPFVVGTSIISTSNYVARKFGIRSGMPVFIAKSICPELTILPVDTEKYSMYSEKVFDILKMYDENVIKRGCDEGYFKILMEDDVVFQNDELISELIMHQINEIKREIKKETNLTMSVGISFNPKIAKMAAEKNKPDGLFILRRKKECVYEYLDSLNVRKLSGIGPTLEYLLNGLGIFTIKDLREQLWKVYACFSQREADSLLADVTGFGKLHEEIPVSPSLSKSRTFKATDDISFLNKQIRSLADS